MKKLLLSATAIATVMSVSAIAADLPSIKSAPVAPAPIWTGFYAGLNSGYGWGLTPGAYSQTPLFDDKLATKLTSSPSGLGAANTGTAQLNQSGYLGGAQVGYNKQFYERYLVGLEADIQGSSISGLGTYSGAGATRFRTEAQNISGFGETQARINWFGTVRGRFGFLITPTLLTYATGGLTYAGVTASNNYGSLTYSSLNNGTTGSQQLLIGSGGASNTLYGWNVGGGAEWMFSPNWSMKSEVIYYNLGTQSFSGFGYSPNPQGGSNSQSTLNQTSLNYAGIIARAGLNYHLNTDKFLSSGSFLPIGVINPLSSTPENKILSWNGFYAGLNAGYGWSGHGINTVANAYDASVYWHSQDRRNIGNGGLATVNSGWSSVNQGGFLGGLQAGYNYQYGSNIVVGLETDIQGSSMQGSGGFSGRAITPTYLQTNELNEFNNYSGATNIQAGMDWFGSTRGRLGYLIKPSLLLFGTGGLSYGGVYGQTNFSSSTLVYNVNGNSDTFNLLGGNGRTTASLVGWNAGAGLEWMFMQSWSLKTEAIYYDLGSMTLKGSGYSPDAYGNNPDPDYQFVSTKASIRYNGVIARMGVNYHFDFGKEQPITAKY